MKKKIFIGIEIPEEVKKQLWGVSESLQKFGYPVGWVAKEKFHLTLIYLGYLREEKLDKVVKIMQEEIPKSRSLNIKLCNIEGFPNAKNPRVITMSLESRNAQGTSDLEKIYKDLKNILLKNDFKIEERDFSGHVTLGRVKSDDFYLKRKISEMMKEVKMPEFKKIKVSKITLFESIFTGKEFVYKILLSIPLGTR